MNKEQPFAKSASIAALALNNYMYKSELHIAYYERVTNYASMYLLCICCVQKLMWVNTAPRFPLWSYVPLPIIVGWMSENSAQDINFSKIIPLEVYWNKFRVWSSLKWSDRLGALKSPPEGPHNFRLGHKYVSTHTHSNIAKSKPETNVRDMIRIYQNLQIPWIHPWTHSGLNAHKESMQPRE